LHIPTIVGIATIEPLFSIYSQKIINFIESFLSDFINSMLQFLKSIF